MKSRLVVVSSFLLLLAGCAVAPTIQSPVDPVAYPPMASSAHIAGSATIEASYDPAPEMQETWRRAGFNDTVIEQHRQGVASAIVNDFAASGLFTRVLPISAGARPDYALQVHCVTSKAPGYMSLRISLNVLNGATGAQTWTFTREAGLGPIDGPHLPLSQVLPQIMSGLKADLAGTVARKAREDAEAAEIAGLKTASIAELLVSSDRNTSIARERNRALVAAKNAQLPDLLRSWKTEQLSALVVKIEQTILDLNHECEVAKDKAQQSVADGTNAGGGGEDGVPNFRRARMDAITAAARVRPAGALGFLGIAMTDAAGGGVAVQSVVAGGPAEQAGLKTSDIIFDVDGQSVPTAQELQSRVSGTAPGSSVRLRIGRDGAEQFVTVVLGQRRDAAPNSVESLRDLSISYRERIELLKPILQALKEEIANRNR